MSRAYDCRLCRQEIPSVAAHVVTEGCQVLCASCAENPVNHTVVHPACGHHAARHP
jgi:hypothetical protein